MSDFETPDMEVIAIEVLKPLVSRETQVMTMAEDIVGLLESQQYSHESVNIVVVQRKGGYLTDGFTEIAGLEVRILALTEKEAKKLSAQARNLFLSVETKSVDAESLESDIIRSWTIDFVEVLDGPEYEDTQVLTENQRILRIEIHSRVYWP